MGLGKPGQQQVGKHFYIWQMFGRIWTVPINRDRFAIASRLGQKPELLQLRLRMRNNVLGPTSVPTEFLRA